MKQTFLDATVDPQKMIQAMAEAFSQLAQQSPSVQRIQKATGTPIGPYVHGPGGLFGVRGLERDVISTHTNIVGSLGEMLPIRPDVEMNPLFPYITGFLRSDEKEKNAICDDPVDAGNMKTCLQTTVFGRKEFKTRTVEINHIGQSINRSEFFDLVLVNDPLVNQMGGLMQNFTGIGSAQAILAGREMVARFMEVGVAYQRWFCPTVYTGNPSNGSAGGGYKEFPGLQLLIGRNKIDALTGAACPSLYSDVKDFGYKSVDSSTEPDIYRVLSTMAYILENKAVQQNMAPIDLRLVMRSQLFFELTRFWPIKYNTDGIGLTPAGLDQFYLESIRQRDDMRNNLYLIINSKRYPVILDDCIGEDNHADNGAIGIGGFASDIYFVPFSVRGGTYPTLYWHYYDYSKGTLPAVSDARAGSFFWSDGGVFLWGIRPPNNWCLDVISKVEPRLILRTPQLAGRLQHVQYTPLQHTDDPLPSQDYHLNGGVRTGRPFPSPYSEWNTGGPGPGA